MPGIDIKRIDIVLKSIKGVGEKRAAEIVKALEAELVKDNK